MELGFYFLFLQEQIQDIIITRETLVRTSGLTGEHLHVSVSEPCGCPRYRESTKL
jgi:hypothetical protein